MPYIKPGPERDLLKHQADKMRITTPGELNFVVSTLVKNYTARFGKSYMILNDIVGALECAKSEFYRRVVGPYEDTKIKENGDVYWNG
jgi:hypothetical protein